MKALMIYGATGSTMTPITGEAFPEVDLSQLPAGPTQAQREAHHARAVADLPRAAQRPL